jgi:phage-related protein
MSKDKGRKNGNPQNDVEQEIEQNADQSLDQSNSITGVSVTASASGEYSDIELKHVDAYVDVHAFQFNVGKQEIDQTATNTAEGAPKGDVEQEIEQNASQSMTQSNSIVGVNLDLTASDGGDISFHGVDFNVDVHAVQGNYGEQDIDQTATNNWFL